MVKTRREGRRAHVQAAAEPPTPRAAMPDLPASDQGFVEELIALAVSMAPEFAQHAEKYGDEVRKRFGGDRLYIAHGRDTSSRDAAIKRDYLAGAHFGLLERRYGLGKRQLIRIVKS